MAIYPAVMADAPGKFTGVLTAFVSAALTAYALAYIAHAEWGLRRAVIREEAIGMAAILVMTMIATMIFQRNGKNGS
jgi:hypothetical protein